MKGTAAEPAAEDRLVNALRQAGALVFSASGGMAVLLAAVAVYFEIFPDPEWFKVRIGPGYTLLIALAALLWAGLSFSAALLLRGRPLTPPNYGLIALHTVGALGLGLWTSRLSYAGSPGAGRLWYILALAAFIISEGYIFLKPRS
ncbi:MAG TPA: hypothetical protein PKI19_11555 [Elusimicrobiales bacterium]|nr:hypothetical protein [Elusimicrobiales bacterium]